MRPSRPKIPADPCGSKSFGVSSIISLFSTGNFIEKVCGRRNVIIGNFFKGFHRWFDDRGDRIKTPEPDRREPEPDGPYSQHRNRFPRIDLNNSGRRLGDHISYEQIIQSITLGSVPRLQADLCTAMR